MSTVVLDAYSKAFPTITNRIRAAVFNENDLSAPVATIIDTAVGHPERIYHFPGLPRANYAFSLDEIDGGGIPIRNLAHFDVVPSSVQGYLSRDDEQIRVGSTPGFNAGLSVVTFNGSGGTPDYRGWDIVPSELTGRGILVRGLDYSWDSVTGTMTWLIPGDVLQPNVNYNIHFNPIVNNTGGSEPTVIDFSARIVTISTTIDLTDFGGTVIVEPSLIYMELALPIITTVPVGRPVTIEVVKALGANVKCTRVVPNGSDVINFLRGNVFLMNNESLQIYRFKRPDTSNEWRVRFADGNFKTVGQNVSDDCIQTGVYCKQLLDGSVKDRFQYARIYDEIVVNLPSVQVCNFDAWATGFNKYLYSLANSADPSNVNKFHFPDRRGIFERNNNTGKAGDYNEMGIEQHSHRARIGGSNSPDPVAGLKKSNLQDGFFTSGSAGLLIDNYGGAETQPKNYLINKYVLV